MAGPLDGVRILDFSTLLPGPFATLWMADLGADVVRIVAPARARGAAVDPIDPAAAAFLNRNKRSIVVDLKRRESRQVIDRLIARADVLVEQFRPGVMDALTLGYEDVRRVNPAIVYCSLTGYGQTGPYRRRAGHDLNYLAVAGVLSYSGRAGAPPAPPAIQVADLMGAMSAVAAVLASLYRRQRSGGGEHVDVAMMDSALALNVLAGTPLLAGRGPAPEAGTGPLNGGSLYDCYETRDGRYLAVASFEPKFLQALFVAIGRTDLIAPAAGISGLPDSAAIKKVVGDAIAGRTLDEWMAVFEHTDACVEPVLTLAESCDHPQTRARGMIVEVDADGGPVRQFAHPVRYSAGGAAYDHAGRPDGAETDAILREVDFADAEIERMRQRRVVS